MKQLNVRGKKVELPVFLPDATHGFVRGVGTQDLVDCGIEGVVVNAYHLFRDGLVEEIKKKAGIGDYMGFKGLTLSDSGGFQVFSLIHNIKSSPSSHHPDHPTPKNEIKKSDFGYLDDNGATFMFDGKKVELTPEKCIQIQIDIGADIIMCLDDCTSPDMSEKEQEKSVERTIRWATRCKREFVRLAKDLKEDRRPLLFGIIQGGKNLELRKKCADELIKIGFDGYAFGGWPAEDGKFLTELLKYTAELMPDDKPKYAMGVGRPEDIVNCVCMGYNMFDCVIPTREARNNRLYAFKSSWFGFSRKSFQHQPQPAHNPDHPPLKNKLLSPQSFGFFKYPKKPNKKGDFYDYVRIRNVRHSGNKKPISKHCSGICCRNYKSSDIYEMFRAKDKESIRLATMHNLRFYTMLMEMLRKNRKV